MVFENQYAMTMPPSPAYMEESAEVGGNVLEKVTVEAGRRIENLL